MPRDNFSKKVIEKLKARVSNRCSNPSCRVPTSAPAGIEDVNNIGIAAHICAAAPGGPRYDQSMSPRERGSIQNAIWLCSNCSIDIDRDPGRYTIGLLRDWKATAENTARLELGNKLPSNNETIDTVAVALTGFPKSFLAKAISNVHQASERSLESLDPRFSVKTAHCDGVTSAGIYAKESVSLLMKVDGAFLNEYIDKHRRLIEHGEDIEINSKAITIEGSRLFEQLFNENGGVLKVAAPKHKATQKVWLVESGTSIVETFDDIAGLVSIGSESFTFNGHACDNIFCLSYRAALDANNRKATMTMSLNLSQWEGKDLEYLPYFEKLVSLFSKMAKGWELFTSLEVKGVNILATQGMMMDGSEYVLDTANLLGYINRCRIVARKLKRSIRYTSEVSFSAEEHKHLADIVDALEGKQEFGQDNITSNASCDLVVGDGCDNVKMLGELTEPTLIRIVQKDVDTVALFGIVVELPPKVIILESVLPRVHGDIDKLKVNDVVKVEWMPQKGFRCSVRYES